MKLTFLVYSLLLPSISEQITIQEIPSKIDLTPESLETSLTLDGLLTHSKALWSFANLHGSPDEGITRSFASVGFNASADYATDARYRVERQKVDYIKSVIGPSTLTIDGVSILQKEHRGFQYSPSATLTGPLILIPNNGCDSTDYKDLDSGLGEIAFILRGICTFDAKATLAKSHGFSGALIFNNLDGAGPVLGILGSDFENNLPALALSKEAAAPFVEKLNVTSPPRLIVSLSIDSKSWLQPSDNVIATSTWGDQDKILLVGAHLDSVPAGPGINDDGSGTATIAEIAIQLANFGKIKNAIRFAWWTAEEVGLVGSDYYISNLPAAEKAKIYANINLDMTASPNYIIGIYDGDNSEGKNTDPPAPPGSAVIENLYKQWYVKHNINYTSYAMTTGSDYRPFIDHGIPSGGVATGASGNKSDAMFQLFGGTVGIQYDPCYHQACDDINNLAHDPYIWNARATANVIAQLLQDEDILNHPPPPGLLKSGPGEHFAADVKETCGDHLHDI